MADWETTKLKSDVKREAGEMERWTYSGVMRAGIEAIKADVVGANQDGDIWVNPESQPEPTPDFNPDELAARIVDAVGVEAGGPQVDDSEIAREVARQLDYTAIADKVSRQVVRELQG